MSYEHTTAKLKASFPWITDEIFSSLSAMIQNGEVCVLAHKFDDPQCRLVGTQEELLVKTEAIFRQFTTDGFQKIQSLAPELFNSLTPSEKYTLLATETAEFFFSGGSSQSTDKTGGVARLVIMAGRRAESISNANLAVIDLLEDTANIQMAVIIPPANPDGDAAQTSI